MFFHGIRTSTAKKTFTFVIFQGGGAGQDIKIDTKLENGLKVMGKRHHSADILESHKMIQSGNATITEHIHTVI